MGDVDVVMGLPPLTRDLEEAKAHLDTFGVARIAGALGPAQVAALKTRLTEQATAERAAGVAFLDGGGANQRVWNLPSKGEVFVDLLRTPIVPWSYFASNVYHNKYWYPRQGKKRIEAMMDTEWGRLFKSY